MIRLTRLHSSRMHTARLLTVSPSMHCAGGEVPDPGGCLVRGVSALRGAWSRGGSAPGGGVVSQHA